MRKKRNLLIIVLGSVLIFSACSRKEDNTGNIMTENPSTATAESTQTAAVTPADTEGDDSMAVDNKADYNTGNNVAPIETPVGALTEAPAETQTMVMVPGPESDYVSGDMYKNAMLNEGDLARLAAVMRKARDGEEITVAVIGGSITQGSLATSVDRNYASIFYRWWQKAFPDAKINFINDGIGATTSYLAVHRIDRDLLPYKPDVVVVEFSVNDSNTLFYKETYEDLIRRILKAGNNPAVIPLFMTMEDGTSAITQHLLVSFTYNLPRISYGQAVLKEISNGAFTWDNISPDNIHPNDLGHAITGEILWKYLNGVYAKLDKITEEVTPLAAQPIFTEAYIDASILDSSNLKPVKCRDFEKAKVFDRFPNDWRTTGGNASIVFETEAQNIGLMYYRTVDSKSGQFDVYIDGVFAAKLNADFTGGWGNYAEAVEVFRSKEKKVHKIEIKKAEDSTGNGFSFLGLLIS